MKEVFAGMNYSKKSMAALASILFLVTFAPIARAEHREGCVEAENKKKPDALDNTKNAVEAIQRNVDRITSTIISCKDADLWHESFSIYTVPIGFKCRTSKGAIFERVVSPTLGEVWKGPDSVVWSDQVDTGTQSLARQRCAQRRATLPSCTDFERNEAYGFREVLPSMQIPERWYWSASAHPEHSDGPCIFFGHDGTTHTYSARSIGSILCVGR
ncbi:MAG: hypothetical protein HYV97_19245 [Bdellovibrio sp.]|nr:hypothetical protein [Bdellovibrio sp.]